MGADGIHFHDRNKHINTAVEPTREVRYEHFPRIESALGGKRRKKLNFLHHFPVLCFSEVDDDRQIFELKYAVNAVPLSVKWSFLLVVYSSSASDMSPVGPVSSPANSFILR